MSKKLLNQAMVALAEEHLEEICQIFSNHLEIDEDTMKTVKNAYLEQISATYGHSAAGGKPAKKTKDPNAPKKALSAYMYYTSDARSSAKEKLGEDAKTTEIAKEMGAMWKSLSDAEKAPYVRKAEEDKARYEKEHQAYMKKQSKEAPTSSK